MSPASKLLESGTPFGLWRVVRRVEDPRPGVYYLCVCIGPAHPLPVQHVVRATTLRRHKSLGCRACRRGMKGVHKSGRPRKVRGAENNSGASKESS